MKTKYDTSHLLLSLVALGLLITNILLILQNYDLRASLSRSKQFVTEIGYKFSTVPAVNLNGDEASLNFDSDGKRTAVFVFNTNCEYCIQQYPGWKDLINSLDRRQWNVIGVTSETDSSIIAKHLKENDLAELDVRIVSSKAIADARLGFTPMTILVDSQGLVGKVWAGLWTKGFNLDD